MTLLDWTLYPASGEPAPSVLVLPGGAYRLRAEHEGEPVARWLNALGIHAAVLHYPVGEGCWPRPLVSARAALATLRRGEGLPVDTARIGVLGSSAGGHLAGLLATDSRDVPLIDSDTYAGRPDAVLLSYPVAEMGDMIGAEPNLHTASADQLLGLDADQSLRAAISLPARVDASMPECFIWTTRDDERVPSAHTLSLLQALDAAGVSYEAHVFRRGLHGLGLATDQPSVAQWTRLAECWLTEIGWVKRQA